MKEMKPLRIALAIQNAGNDLAEDVGPALLLKRIVRGLQEKGHSISVLRLMGREVWWHDDVDHLDRRRLAPLGWSGSRAFKLVESAARRLQGELKLPYFAWFDSFRFFEACQRGLKDFSLIHEYGGLFSVGTALACRRNGQPYVLTVEADAFLEKAVKGAPLRGLHELYARQAAKFTYRIADRIVTVSEQAKAHFVQAWGVSPEKIRVMQNGVDVQRFRPDQNHNSFGREYGLRTGAVVGFVGSFQHWHGLTGLLESFSRVIQEAPEARLLLVGDGPARTSVEQKVRELGLERSVTLTGLVSQDQVPEALAAMDVAVVPYPKLPMELWFSPMKLFEYMAAGKAIVATRDGQIAQVINDGINGILVEPGDTAGFARAIIRLIRSPAERRALGEQARKHAVEQHSMDAYIRRLEDIYLETIHEKNISRA